MRRIDELNPDGVRMTVDWDAFVPGTSIFVPALNTEEAAKQARGIAQLRGWGVEVRLRIENGMRGIRVWRLK